MYILSDFFQIRKVIKDVLGFLNRKMFLVVRISMHTEGCQDLQAIPRCLAPTLRKLSINFLWTHFCRSGSTGEHHQATMTTSMSRSPQANRVGLLGRHRSDRWLHSKANSAVLVRGATILEHCSFDGCGLLDQSFLLFALVQAHASCSNLFKKTFHIVRSKRSSTPFNMYSCSRTSRFSASL